MVDLIGKDGGPFQIVARGDCTSRRSVHLNRDMFPKGVDFIQSQKSPAILFLDADNGLSVSEDELRAICDVSAMSGSLPDFYIGQADRSILKAVDADLILIDSYADMNFELWENKEKGWKIWIHPKFLKNPDHFYANFRKLGRRSFEQSVREIGELVKILRKKSPNAPVLFLNQQVDFYPKMSARIEYYQLGARLVQEVPNLFFGGVVDKDSLKLADVGSCGPGLTLHFQAKTYREMWETALRGGLREALELGPSSSRPQTKVESAVSGAEPVFETLIARDNPDAVQNKVDGIDFELNSTQCGDRCPARENIVRSFENYIRMRESDNPLRWTPVVINLEKAGQYSDWERSVKKSYDRVRMKRKSIGLGYKFKQFHPKLFSVDIFDINRSTTVRSGGEIRGSLKKSIDELGGYPQRYLEAASPSCLKHWQMSFGIFKDEPGHRQGDVVVNERLLGYISLNRNGELCNYSQIIGHHDHLGEGVMYHCHFNIVEWLLSPGNRFASGARYLMYGGVGNGGAGLWQWKRTSGFVPVHLFERVAEAKR